MCENNISCYEYSYKYNEKNQCIYSKLITNYVSEIWRDLDQNGNCIYEIEKVVEDDGTIKNYERWREFDEKGNMIHYINNIEGGNEEWNEYDERGNLIHRHHIGKTINGNEFKHELIYKYDDHNNCIYKNHKNCGRGSRIWYFHNEYDERGNLIEITSDRYELGNIYHKEWFGYDENNRLIYHRNTIGPDIEYEYDERGNLIKTINRYNFNTEYYEYDDNGNKIFYYIKYDDGKKSYIYCRTWYEYDENNRLTHEYSSEGDITRIKYDEKGNIIWRLEIY